MHYSQKLIHLTKLFSSTKKLSEQDKNFIKKENDRFEKIKGYTSMLNQEENENNFNKEWSLKQPMSRETLIGVQDTVI